MKTTRMASLAAALLLPLVFVSCNDDNSSRISNGSSNTVPDSAGTSVKRFFDYLFSLNMSDERSEPAVIKEGFALPEDEANEPTPLS